MANITYAFFLIQPLVIDYTPEFFRVKEGRIFIYKDPKSCKSGSYTYKKEW